MVSFLKHYLTKRTVPRSPGNVDANFQVEVFARAQALWRPSWRVEAHILGGVSSHTKLTERFSPEKKMSSISMVCMMYLNLMAQVLSNQGVVRLVNFEKSKLAKKLSSWQSTFIMSSFLHVFRLSPYKIQNVIPSPTIILKMLPQPANEWIHCFPKK